LSTYRFPTPPFDAIMTHDFMKERLAQMKLSIAEARKLYEKEAPPFIQYSVVHSPEKETAEPVDDAPPPGVTGPLLKKEQALPKSPMSLKGFIATLAPIAKSAKRTPQPVSSADLSPNFVLSAPVPTTPGAPKAMRQPPNDPEAAKEAANPLGKQLNQQKKQ
jgi:hypothetical protein